MENEIFNLVRDPWILVRDLNGEVEETSISGIFENAQDYLELAGETPTQDFAILRLLLAISITVCSRYLPDGQAEEIESTADALDRWADYWNLGEFPHAVFSNYLKTVEDRFNLNGTGSRFMQTQMAEKGTYNKTAKLISDQLESANKYRLFQGRSGEPKEKIPFDEAARYLVNLNAYDDNALKSTAAYKTAVKEGRTVKETPGIGWVGKLGIIYAKGGNLFETIMLNTVLLKNGKDLWGENRPRWEEEKPDYIERQRIEQPDNPAELLTLPSRHIWLHETEDGKIDGVSVVGGKFFEKTNADSEQWTLWRNSDPKKKKMTSFNPKRHMPGRQLWRDFQALAEPEDKSKTKQPGIVLWLNELSSENILPDDMPIQLCAPTVIYGDKDFNVNDISSSSMLLYPTLFAGAGQEWRSRIEQEINNIDELARAIGLFAIHIALASGSGEDIARNRSVKAQEIFYSEINTPFTEWLARLNPKTLPAASPEGMQAVQSWHEEARKIGFETARQILGPLRPGELFGRTVQRNKTEIHVSVPEAQQILRHKIYTLYPLEK